jgi:hypothetical protein
MIGPAFEFRDYQKFIAREGPFKNIPSSVIPTLKCVALAIPAMYIFVAYSSTLNHYMFAEPDFIAKYSFFYRLLFLFYTKSK